MVHDNGVSEEPSIVTRYWKPVSIISLISVIPVAFAVNAAYDSYHMRMNDQRYVQLQEAEATYAKKAEVFHVAQAQEMEEHVAQIDQSLDFLVKSAAVQAVDKINNDLIAHQMIDDGSDLWRRQEGELKRKLANAEDYRDCLFRENGINCDASRVW